MPREIEPTTSLPPVIEYYSGSQVTVFIDDIWVDDAASYEIAIQQTKQPIYGYGSQHYDLVAKGKVSVNGSITLNFKDPNYLWIILANKFSRARASDRARQKQKEDELNRFAGSDLGLDKLMTEFGGDIRGSQTKNFGAITDMFKKKYWNRPDKNPLIEEEPMNHSPFDMHFLYKGDTPGVIERLEGVEILGKAKTIQIDGQPIAETYNFIARKFR